MNTKAISIAGMLAAAGLQGTASGATTTLDWTVSVNGGAFGVIAYVHPGDTVTCRLRVSLSNNSGTGSIPAGGGLAGFNFLPTLSNFQANDSPLPLGAEQFATGSSSNPVPLVPVNHPNLGLVNVYTGTLPIAGRHGSGAIGGTGRQAPFGANGTNTNGVATPSVESGTLVWRSGIISNSGVSISQLNAAQSYVNVPVLNDNGTPGDTSDDFVDYAGNGGSFATSSRVNVTVFSYSFVKGAEPDETILTVGCSVLTPIFWYTSAAGAAASTDQMIVNTASIVYFGSSFPTPASTALLGLSGVWLIRRRRPEFASGRR